LIFVVIHHNLILNPLQKIMIQKLFTLFLMLSVITLGAQDLIERTQLGIANPEYRSSPATHGIASTLDTKRQNASSRSSQSYQLFEITNQKKSLPSNITKGVQLSLQKEVLENIRNTPSTLLNLTIPVNEAASFELELYQITIYSPGFKVTTSTPVDQEVNHTGIFYQGIIKGNPNSAVSVSIFDDMVDIFIQDHVGNYKVATNTGKEDYTLYNGHNRLKKNKVACGTQGSPSREITSNETVGHSRSNRIAEVPIYLEVDYALYLEKNRNLNTATRFIEILVAETTALYARLDIPIKISQLKIHTTPDGYPGGVGDPKLTAFSEAIKGNFTGILAHLISGEEGGGIATLGVLCSTYEKDGLDGPYGLSGIGVPDAQTPDLDDINTFAHELGHNFGSVHTQACFWNGNNTAIDGCVESESTGEDGEITCPRPNTNCPAGGGTIMSYCSTPDAPLFDCIANNNWHPQVAAHIKSQYAEAIANGCIENVMETTDVDQDGFDNSVDCNDNNAQVNPNQTEIAYNGIDDDCNAATLDDDLDRDGFGRANDCDDTNANIYPGAPEISDNGIDEDCNGQDAITAVVDNTDNDNDMTEEEVVDEATEDAPTTTPTTPTNTGSCAPISGNLTTSSTTDNNSYIYTPQPNGAINNQFRYRPIGSTIWITTDISTSYFRYLSNLSAGTTYEFQVSQICPDGSFSDFSASATFTTTGQAQGSGSDTTTDTDAGSDTPTTGSCAGISGNLTTSSIGNNNAYIYTPQPNGAINNQFRYRPINSDTWITTDISNNYFRYLSNLSAGTIYEFQVSQICPDGSFSSFSASALFTTTGQAQTGGNNTDNNDAEDVTIGNNVDDINCLPVTSDQLYVSSVTTSAAYVYTPQPHGVTNNQFRYRVVGTVSWTGTEMNTLYYRYLTGLSAGTTYEYQVQQECASGATSSYSDSYEFTTATNSQSSELTTPIDYATFLKLSTTSKTTNIQVSPNPVFNELSLHLGQISTTSSTVRIYNISGKLLKERSLQQGVLKATLDVNDLQSGLYLLEYRTAGLWKTTKFIKR